MTFELSKEFSQAHASSAQIAQELLQNLFAMEHVHDAPEALRYFQNQIIPAPRRVNITELNDFLENDFLPQLDSYNLSTSLKSGIKKAVEDLDLKAAIKIAEGLYKHASTIARSEGMNATTCLSLVLDKDPIKAAPHIDIITAGLLKNALEEADEQKKATFIWYCQIALLDLLKGSKFEALAVCLSEVENEKHAARTPDAE